MNNSILITFAALVFGFAAGILIGLCLTARRKKAPSQTEQEYYLKLEEQLSILSAFRHDYRNHIAVLDYHLSQNDPISARHYLMRLQKIQPVSDLVVSTPSRTLSAILSSKQYLCAAQQIQLSLQIDFPGFYRMEPESITILFGNILDNAIHAVSLLPQEMQQIQLTILQVSTYLTIECKNACVFVSAAPDILPGQGIRNIRAVVSRHQGTVDIHSEPGLFVITILLPNHL